MGIEQRKELIADLEALLNARMLVLVTGDRQQLETRIAPDLLPLVSEHLSRIGFSDRLALFLYTPGGDSITGWGLVNLLRQYCKQLIVLVPFRALSCGTLIVLGADEVVMGRRGFLSPVDPSVGSPFNPPAPGPSEPGHLQLLPVSVEDMIGFLDLARKEANLQSEAAMVEVLRMLASQVHPLALGAVYRAREQSGKLAEALLSKHMQDKEKVHDIVNRLTRELPTHSYLIGRREAADDVGIPLVDVTDEVDLAMWNLYKQYADWMRLTQPANPESDLGTEQHKAITHDRAAIESVKDGILFQHVYVSEVDYVRVKVQQPGLQVSVDQVIARVLYMGWKAYADGEAPKS